MESIFKYFFDRQIRISSKAAFIVIGTAIIILFNDIFNFSSSYVVNDKISQIKELNSIIKDSTTDEKTKYFAFKTRQEVIENSNCIENLANYFKNISWEKKVEKINNPKPKELIQTSQNEIIERNVFWQHLSAGGFFYVCGIIFIFVIIFDKHQDLVGKVATIIVVSFMFFIFGWLMSALIGLIPIFDKSRININYAINVIVQGLVLFGMYKLIKRGDPKAY